MVLVREVNVSVGEGGVAMRVDGKRLELNQLLFAELRLCVRLCGVMHRKARKY